MASFAFNYLLIPFLNWGYYVIGFLAIFIAVFKRFAPSPDFQLRGFNWVKLFSRVSYKSLIWSVLFLNGLYASVETFAQYYVWSGGPFTKLFLDQRTDIGVLKEFAGKLSWIFNNRFGYFIFYSWGRFWMQIVVSLLAAGAFYLFLLALKKHKERFFEEGEAKLGFLLALAVGWPNFIVFLFAAFLSVILVSVVKMIFFKEAYTTLGAPFLIAAFISVFFGTWFINLFNLVAFRV